jgi:hypothetical protein
MLGSDQLKKNDGSVKSTKDSTDVLKELGSS